MKRVWEKPIAKRQTEFRFRLLRTQTGCPPVESAAVEDATPKLSDGIIPPKCSKITKYGRFADVKNVNNSQIRQFEFAKIIRPDILD